MPNFRYSNDSIYWRNLCRNRLFPETGTERCEVCIYPETLPPVANCSCTVVQRPNGWPASMNLRLGSTIGADTISSSELSSTLNKSVNSSSRYTPVVGMSPADGTKTSTAVRIEERKWATVPTETEFNVKNLSVYVPSLVSPVSGLRCYWYGIANMQLHWRVWHATVVRGKSTPLSWTYDGRTYRTYDLEELLPYEEVSGTKNLSNNEATSIWACSPLNTMNNIGYYGPGIKNSALASRVPEYYNSLPREVYEDLCERTACNQACHPVTGYCSCTSGGGATVINGLTDPYFAYWRAETCLTGYLWEVTPRWTVNLYLHSGMILRKDSITGIQPTIPSLFFNPLFYTGNTYFQLPCLIDQFNPALANSPNAWPKYPASYQNSITFETGWATSAFSSGFTGTKLDIGDPVGGGILGSLGTGSVLKKLAVWTRSGNCSEEGEVELTLSQSYLTSRPAGSPSIFGGPASFPTNIYLNVGTSGL